MIRRKVFKESDYHYHLRVINIISSFWPKKLNPAEREILAHFCSLGGGPQNDVFGTTIRKAVRKKLACTPQNIQNLLGSLENKDVIKRDGDKLVLSEAFHIDENKMEFYLVCERNES